MTDVQSLPKWIGFFLLGLGFMFLIPLFAMVQIFLNSELWFQVIEDTGWSHFMILWVVADMLIIVVMFAYAGDIIYYNYKDKTIEEKAEESEFKPRE